MKYSLNIALLIIVFGVIGGLYSSFHDHSVDSDVPFVVILATNMGVQ